MRIKQLLSASALVISLAGYSQTGSASFNFTASAQTFTVPCGVDTVFIQAWGGQGGAGAQGGVGALGGSGGLGGYSEGYLLVNPGDVLNIYVGGQGGTPTAGWNGGANGGSQNAGGGGGASDVRVGGTTEADRVITAGGGGGGGRGGCESGTQIVGGNGGSGGSSAVAMNGIDAPTSGGAAGGGFGGNAGNVQGAAGAAGIGCGGFLGLPGFAASGGTGGAGGNGQSCCCFSFGSIPGGGGGGGGQIGGGGGGGGSAGTTGCSGNDKGAGGGGGGGSSYIGGVLNGVANNGIWLGNGMVQISWTIPSVPNPIIASSALSICLGDSANLGVVTMPSNVVGGYWSTPSFVTSTDTTQPTITVYGTSAGTGSIMVTWWEACGDTAVDTVTFTVNALPVVTYSEVFDTACAADGAYSLSGMSPGGGTFSGNAVSGGMFDPTQAASSAFNVVTYTYTDGNGCTNSAMDSIWVDLCLGMTTVQMTSISIAPNPATDVVTLSWNAKTSVTAINIMDATGRVVMTENTINGNTKRLDVSALPAGTYTVSTVGSATTVQTFVKK